MRQPLNHQNFEAESFKTHCFSTKLWTSYSMIKLVSRGEPRLTMCGYQKTVFYVYSLFDGFHVTRVCLHQIATGKKIPLETAERKSS